jgi:hypothetical protein
MPPPPPLTPTPTPHPAGEVMLVPANVMNLWLAKFENKFKRDPDFLTRQVGVGRTGGSVGA